MAHESKAEARGRGVRRRYGSSDGSGESQSSAAALGGRGATAGAASGRSDGEEHHGVGSRAGLRADAAAKAKSCRVGRQGVVYKHGRAARAGLPSEAKLQGRFRLLFDFERRKMPCVGLEH